MWRSKYKSKTRYAYGACKRRMKQVRAAKSSLDPTIAARSEPEITAPACSSTAAAEENIVFCASQTTMENTTVHLETQYVSQEEADATTEHRNVVRAKLASVSATQRKFELLQQAPAIATSSSAKFTIVQLHAINELLGYTVCQSCSATGVRIQESTALGLAVKLELVCPVCEVVTHTWSSPRKVDSNAFDVNLRAISAIRSIGKGQTALNDFWAVMNVSHRGLHHKTYQDHLKNTVSKSAAATAEKIYTESAAAVKSTYREMNPDFTKDVAVVYDGTWLKRGYSSHVGVGSVIEYDTGLILDAEVLSNLCHGCQTGPKLGEERYSEWHQNHECQKNTDANSGRMEVDAALAIFGRSLEKHDLRYTTLISDGDSRTFCALVEDKTYGFLPIKKEECLNHVQKRMGTALRKLLQNSDKPLGGKGRLTKVLIERLTGYYGWAIRSHSNDVEAMKRAVMATYYHVTSTDEDPKHDLCPGGPESWCRNKVADAKGQPQPKHKYSLPNYVAEAMLRVYERLSQTSLFERCLGAKTQNAAESFHSVLWALMPKEQHASLVSVQTALHEAVVRFNAGYARAHQEMSSAMNLQPAHLALRRASEKDSLRLHKATKRHSAKTEARQKRTLQHSTQDYAAGSF
ncbi:uncharacterized protein ISCGN_020982 [Ixodes scapularis]